MMQDIYGMRTSVGYGETCRHVDRGSYKWRVKESEFTKTKDVTSHTGRVYILEGILLLWGHSLSKEQIVDFMSEHWSHHS